MVVNARFVKPMDKEILDRIVSEFDTVITVEENTVIGGFGSGVLEELAKRGFKGRVKLIGIPDEFIEHGARKKLLEVVGLTVDGILKQIKNFLSSNNS